MVKKTKLRVATQKLDDSNMLPTQRYVTASSQQVQGLISLDGRSRKSRLWDGGAAYVLMCVQCGLEPSRPNHTSNCMCMCEICSGPLRGHGAPVSVDGKVKLLCRKCGGREVDVVPIGTREVKVKRSRSSYIPHVLRITPSCPTPPPPPHLHLPAAAPAVASEPPLPIAFFYSF
jgi:hypothetical protein